MDMQTVISEKTRRALWDLLAERDTVDNTLSKASEILAAAECFGIKVDSDSFRSQDEIVRIEALIEQNATSARYPAVKSLVTRLLDIKLKRCKPGPNPSSPTTEGNPPLVEKHLQTEDIDSDIVVGPIIHCSSRPKRNKPIVESNNEEEVSDDEDVPLVKRPRTVRSSSLGTGSGIFGWPQELCKKFAMCIEGSKWSENEPLLVKLWADGLKDAQLQVR
ncbi:hypothetical protein BDZ89DRAFT_580839 [Hymenopellis radicata]|nr:hypothetical protein BDZ89DRAFT_580839 [Hymenopellis radicata]